MKVAEQVKVSKNTGLEPKGATDESKRRQKGNNHTKQQKTRDREDQQHKRTRV